MVKRSWKSILGSVISILVFSALAIVCYYLMVTLMKEEEIPITFNSYRRKSDHMFFVTPPGYESMSDLFNPIMLNMYANDTKKNATILEFDSRTDANQWVYEHRQNRSDPQFINMGLGYDGYNVKNGSNVGYRMNIYYNSSLNGALLTSQVNTLRTLWKYCFGEESDFVVSTTFLFQKIQEMAFGALGPMLITTGLISFVPLLISQPIIDINGEIRPFMVSCTLSLFPYWLSTLLIDYLLWFVVTTMVWAIFIIFKIAAFLDNKFSLWYTFVTAGPSFILFSYCMSFFFSSAEGASRQAFLIMILLLIVPMVISIVRDGEENPIWLDICYGFFPHIMLQGILSAIMSRIALMKQPLSYYFKDKHHSVYLIMEYTNIVFYSLILFIIEKVRLHLQSRHAKKTFGNYGQFFKDAKAKHPVTDEAHDMEKLVHDSSEKWAVKIENCSRLFFNTADQPIPAVNCVSLGVKEGSLFGFLGANGAGKTTLIKMITSMLPPSDGSIEINGVDISVFNDPTLLSICPQFNTHLITEMTPEEHFKLFSLLFCLSPEEKQATRDRLMRILELDSIKDTPVRELSGGDARKLAIALSFLGPAKIILLDEPTASLDPVARHHVHEMISSYRGQKTFMLCTHLLSEAESLCDMISIMVKGCVYTCGSPQYLSQKFGTEYKIDVALTDDHPDSFQKVDTFFSTQLPTAELSILRPKARIYSIPASDISLPELFTKMEEGKQSDNGFNYYTCSSSSLERVFMEIVHMSENEDIVYAKKDDKKEENLVSNKDEDDEAIRP